MIFWRCCNCVMFIVKSPTACPHPVHPPPYCMWCVAVSCYVLPPTLKAWDSHHVVVGRCRRCVSGSWVVLVFWGSSCYFEVFSFIFVFIYNFLLPFPSSIASEIMFGECHPPSLFSQEPHALYSLHAHTYTDRNIHPPTHPLISYPLSAIHTAHIQKPNHPLVQAHTPTNAPSFFRFQLGWFRHQKQLG